MTDQIENDDFVASLVELIDEFIDKYRLEIKRNPLNSKTALEKLIIAEFLENDL